MLRCMRTTLTLEDDVAAAIQRLRRESDDSLKTVVNRALREGLKQLERHPEPRQEFVTATVSLGRCRIGDLSDVAAALALAEGDGYR